MHELSLAQGIVQLLEEQAKAQGFSRVRRVFLEIGELAGVEVESLLFGLDVVMRGTLAEGAAIEVSRPEGQGWCLACGAESIKVHSRAEGCPHCGSYQVQVTGGDALRVSELEVD